VGTIELFLLAMGILFGGTEDAWDVADMVLAVSVAVEGDVTRDGEGDVMERDVTGGDLRGRMG